MPSILFICTANVCRSPVAEALWADWQRQQPDAADWHVSSAGTWADAGAPAAGYSQEILGALGLDLSQHRARRVDHAMLAEADLILCMTRSQREAMQVDFPTMADRIYLLSAMAGPVFDVSDPYGGPRQGYVEMVAEVQQLLAAGRPRILALAAARSRAKATGQAAVKTAPLKLHKI
jgi:protein-tyrosine phosphatase